MFQRSSQTRTPLFDDINITPLTDIFLVLLVIMMVVAPTLQQSQRPITLPELKTGGVVNPQWVAVEVDAEEHYFVQGVATDKTALAASLQAAASKATEKKVVLKADAKSQSEAVLTVMEAAAETGLDKLVLAGTPLKGGTATPTPESTPSPASDALL